MSILEGEVENIVGDSTIHRIKFVQILAEAVIIIIMYQNRASLFTATITIMSFLLIMSLTLIAPAMASSKGGESGGGGAVTQEKVSTGNSNLDKEVNGFYSCISKTHQDPPTIEKVNSCYYQALGGPGSGSDSVGTTGNFVATGPGTNPTSTPISTSQHHLKRSL